MSTLLVSESDPRGPKAVAIAADSGQWLKCHDQYGRKLFGIRSSRDANHVYFVTRTSCTCPDARRHMCKHQLAVQLVCELKAEQEARASVGADNVAHLDQTLAAVRTAAAAASSTQGPRPGRASNAASSPPLRSSVRTEMEDLLSIERVITVLVTIITLAVAYQQARRPQ